MSYKFKYYWCLILFALGLACCVNTDTTTHGTIEGKLTLISAQVGGTLDTIDVTRGQKIQVGDLLFTLDPHPQKLEFAETKARLAQAKALLANLKKGSRPTEIAELEAQKQQILAQLKYAQKTKDRYHNLLKKHFIEKAQFDQAETELQNKKAQREEIQKRIQTAQLASRPDKIAAAQAHVEAIQAQHDKMAWTLKQKRIKAPVSGKVFDIFYRQGEVITPPKPVLSLLAPENIHAVFFVPETALSTIRLHQLIHLTCDQCHSPIIATISFISPQAEFTPPVIYSEKTRVKLVYRVEAQLSPQDRQKLHPGQPITVDWKAQTIVSPHKAHP